MKSLKRNLMFIYLINLNTVNYNASELRNSVIVTGFVVLLLGGNTFFKKVKDNNTNPHKRAFNNKKENENIDNKKENENIDNKKENENIHNKEEKEGSNNPQEVLNEDKMPTNEEQQIIEANFAKDKKAFEEYNNSEDKKQWKEEWKEKFQKKNMEDVLKFLKYPAVPMFEISKYIKENLAKITTTYLFHGLISELTAKINYSNYNKEDIFKTIELLLNNLELRDDESFVDCCISVLSHLKSLSTLNSIELNRIYKNFEKKTSEFFINNINFQNRLKSL
jgi:hypothetical protein